MCYSEMNLTPLGPSIGGYRMMFQKKGGRFIFPRGRLAFGGGRGAWRRRLVGSGLRSVGGSARCLRQKRGVEKGAEEGEKGTE